MKFRKRFSIVERDDIVEKSHKYLLSAENNPGLEYLCTQRKLSEETLCTFQLGYIPANVNHQLAGRIIFPLYDPSGHLVAVSSRAIQSTDYLPVYWHEEYEKQFYLYGMNYAKEPIRYYDFVIVVEGQIDVLQLHNHGIKNAVGLGSANLSEFQLSVISRYCRNIVLIFDKDKNLAGQKGASRAMKEASWYQRIEERRLSGSSFLRVIAIDLGEYIDPDQYLIKYGSEKLKTLIRTKLQEMSCQ